MATATILQLEMHCNHYLLNNIMKRKKILVLCPFPEDMAPAQRLKYEQYFDDWRNHGYIVKNSPFMTKKLFSVAFKRGHIWTKISHTLFGYIRRIKDIISVPSYDIIYIFMWVTPLGPAFSEWLTRLLSKKIIFDIDDNVHIGQKLKKSDNPNPILKYIKGKSKPIYLMKVADFVITSSPYLCDVAERTNKNGKAAYITSSVDTNYFIPAKNKNSKNDPVVIGWTGTYSSKPFLDMIAPALQRLSKQIEFEFRIIGNFEYKLDGVKLSVIQFNKDTEIEDLRKIDVAIYPLPNDEWVLGKSGLKAIVCMAMGIPVVSSNVGATPLLYNHGLDIGFLVDDQVEWASALKKLIIDIDLRLTLGCNARVVAENHYSKNVVAIRYRDILDSFA